MALLLMVFKTDYCATYSGKTLCRVVYIYIAWDRSIRGISS
jgi:hypothetical protein